MAHLPSQGTDLVPGNLVEVAGKKATKEGFLQVRVGSHRVWLVDTCLLRDSSGDIPPVQRLALPSRIRRRTANYLKRMNGNNFKSLA